MPGIVVASVGEVPILCSSMLLNPSPSASLFGFGGSAQFWSGMPPPPESRCRASGSAGAASPVSVIGLVEPLPEPGVRPPPPRRGGAPPVPPPVAPGENGVKPGGTAAPPTSAPAPAAVVVTVDPASGRRVDGVEVAGVGASCTVVDSSA